VAGPAGAIKIRLYWPVGDGPFPALVWFHGGGWVIGDIDGSDGTARNLCVGANCVVISVDYRLAPEAKFPGPVDDCVAATLWTYNNAQLYNIDRSRIAVGGDSAGGNLAAAVAIALKGMRGTPKLAHQLLVYPVTAYHTANYPSYAQNADGYLLTKKSMIWFWDQYLRNARDGQDPRAAPINAKDLKGLPSATVITAEFDPLRDEGEAYAKKLQAAGVPVTVKRYDGMIHGFFGMYMVMDKARDAIKLATEELTKAFSGKPAAARPAPARTAAVKKAAPKRAAAKKAAPKRAVAKKAAPKRAAATQRGRATAAAKARKPAARKAAARPAARRAAAASRNGRPAARRTPARATTRKTTTARRNSARPAAKRPTARRATAARRTPARRTTARR
jgi:acetyl esterase